MRAARQAARTSGNAPAQRTTRQTTAAPRRGPHEPEPIADVFLTLVAAHGWTPGTTHGGLRDCWPDIVGPDAAAHWTRPPATCAWSPTPRPGPPSSATRPATSSPTSTGCAPALCGPSTSASAPPPWCSTTRTPTTDRPTTQPARRDDRPTTQPARRDDRPTTQPARRDDRPAAQPARPPLADHHAYQELRRRMREDAAARQAALDEATAEQEAILREHYNRLREPEGAHQPAIEDTPATDTDHHARQQRERHRAALAVARATRAGAIPLRTARPAPPRTGAA
ncbi:hypothetical protein ACGF0D_44035 [Kitasatospora sp. NPDC048298]|uniref:hypothetical protein n=1 Tax=Kitasatospora sp. NPDC048298 TaxID=3364049 RepID=UPI00371789EA